MVEQTEIEMNCSQNVVEDILGKKSIAQSASASISSGQRLHISNDIVGEKKVI